MRVAVNWVRGNCIYPEAIRDLSRSLSDADAAGADCWFVIGGDLVRSAHATLVHWCAGELFVFPLTDAQAAARGVGRNGMRIDRTASRPDLAPPRVGMAISLERLELRDAAVSETTRLFARVHYEVLANGGSPWCARIDFDLPGRHQAGWDYPERPLWGKGMLDISFPPIAREPAQATNFKGPLAVFVRLCAVASPRRPEGRPPISNAVAGLVDVV